MIVVISFTAEKDRYDRNGRLIEAAGTKTVSHGYDLNTGKDIILPCEPWDSFISQHCTYVPDMDEFILKLS